MKLPNKLYELFIRVTDEKDNLSSKRTTLIFSLIYFFIFCSIFSIIAVVAFFISGKAHMPTFTILMTFVMEVMQYNFWIIAASIGLITVEGLAKAMVAKAKVTLPEITVEEGAESPTIIQNAEQIETVDTIETNNIEQVNTENLNENNRKVD